MAEIYTLSGAPYELGAPPSATDIECAQKVKVPLILGSVTRVGSVGVGLFGTYKLLKGKGAAGVVGLLGAGILWVAGGQLMNAAARGFESCRKT